MFNNRFRKVWRIPMILALSTVFGLLAALLGTGIWHFFSWLALTIPLAILVWKMGRAFFRWSA